MNILERFEYIFINPVLWVYQADDENMYILCQKKWYHFYRHFCLVAKLPRNPLECMEVFQVKFLPFEEFEKITGLTKKETVYKMTMAKEESLYTKAITLMTEKAEDNEWKTK